MMRIPFAEECFKIMTEHQVPEHIIAHSKAVCDVATDIAEKLTKDNIKIDKDLVIAGALLHDVRKLEKDHAFAGAKLLEGMGLIRVARIVKAHGLYRLEDENFAPRTIEEKIVFYADKRVVHDKIVSLEDRFKYLKERYGTEDKFYHYTKKIEKELLGGS